MFYDPKEEIKTKSFDTIPEGTYECIVNKTDWKDTSTGGKMLEVEYAIAGGDFDGRLVWQRMNLVNKNEIAVQIAREHLSMVCRAFYLDTPLKDESEMIRFFNSITGKRCFIKTKNKVRKNDSTRIDTDVKEIAGIPAAETGASESAEGAKDDKLTF